MVSQHQFRIHDGMEIVDYPHLQQLLKQNGLWDWGHELQAIIQEFIQRNPHGRTERWLQTLNNLPTIQAQSVKLDAPAVTASTGEPVDQDLIRQELMSLFPWRKGPFHIHGIDIDTEWRSDMKWDRLQAHIASLDGRRVLDIGCGNGYHLWRILGAGARCAVGVDPMRLYTVQFQAIRHFVGPHLPAAILPTGIEELPAHMPVFDSVFSMGVLYHRRDPLQHIQQLASLTRPGGELILETLIIEAEEKVSLQPQERYAQMRNVWHIPSVPLLIEWMQQAGLKNIRVIDVSVTTEAEQRTTEWMPFHSLKDFLHSHDRHKTIEGHPAPVRAVVIANV